GTRAERHGAVSARHEARDACHTQQDISCDLPGSRLCRFNCLDRRPALLELVFTEIGHALAVDLEPLVDPLWAREFLLDVSSLVAKVQNHAIFNSLIEFVGVDVGAEGLNTGSLVLD